MGEVPSKAEEDRLGIVDAQAPAEGKEEVHGSVQRNPERLAANCQVLGSASECSPALGKNWNADHSARQNRDRKPRATEPLAGS